MTQLSQKSNNDFFKTACYFEAALIAIALLLGELAKINPFAELYFSETAVFLGFMGTLPLLLFYLITEQINTPALQKIRTLLFDTLCPPLQHRHWTDLLILAVIAGISEEVLFRGLLQIWLEKTWGTPIGLMTSSLLFGLVHAVTPLYAVLASLISLYLGLSLDYGGQRNLLIPIVIHSCYDFLVFLILLKNYKKQRLIS